MVTIIGISPVLVSEQKLPLPEITAAVGPVAVPVMLMSSIPTHSSFPAALEVMILTCTKAWLSHAAGKVALTAVTSVAKLGPDVASATKPAGTLVKGPVFPIRYCSATA